MIATNIIVTGPDHHKSEALAEEITNHLKSRGFSNVAQLGNVLPADAPNAPARKSLLDALGKSHPTMFTDPINVRPVTVQHLDTDIPYDLPTYDQAATYHVDKKGQGKTLVAFVEKDHPKPPTIMDTPDGKKVVEVAVDRLVERLGQGGGGFPFGGYNTNIDLRSTALDLQADGAIKSGHEIARILESSQNEGSRVNLFQQVAMETGLVIAPDNIDEHRYDARRHRFGQGPFGHMPSPGGKHRSARPLVAPAVPVAEPKAEVKPEVKLKASKVAAT